MLKVGFACIFGASTFFVCDLVKKAAKAKNIEVEFDAFPITELSEKIEDFDIILLGPQTRHKANEVKALTDAHGKKMGVISPAVYGSMDGDRILQLIQEVNES